jgi:hypothetical protein
MLVTVKAYPTLSKTYGEVVCVAGVRTDTPSPGWVRLYPVGFRDLDWSRQFSKYQHISIEAEPHSSDQRPETLRPRVDTLELGETLTTRKKGGWEERRRWIEPLEVESMCDVRRRQELDGTSLGVFRPPEIRDVLIEPAKPRTEGKDLIARQGSLLVPQKNVLKEIPYVFRFSYSCGPKCPGHTQMIIDWEIGAAFLRWPMPEKQRLRALRSKWLNDVCGPKRDVYFFVGNQWQAPKGFLVLGVFYPPKKVSEVDDRDAREALGDGAGDYGAVTDFV